MSAFVREANPSEIMQLTERFSWRWLALHKQPQHGGLGGATGSMPSMDGERDNATTCGGGPPHRGHGQPRMEAGRVTHRQRARSLDAVRS